MKERIVDHGLRRRIAGSAFGTGRMAAQVALAAAATITTGTRRRANATRILAACRLLATFTGAATVIPTATLTPAACRSRQLQFLHVQLALGELLDLGQRLLVMVDHQRQCHAGGAGTAGTADAVHVVLGRMRQIVVDDGRQLGNVQATGRHVGGHQHLDLAGLEAVQRLQALLLGLVAVDGLGQEAFLLQMAGQTAGTDLGVGEDDDLFDAALTNERPHRVTLEVFGGHVVDRLLDVLGQRVGPGHLDELRLVQEALGQLADLVREGGREHQVLPARIEQIDDALDVGQEAHVQHPVRLVQHQQLHLRQVHRLLLDVIQQPSGGGDEDLDAGAQRIGLRLHVDATEDGSRTQRRELDVGLDVVVDLVGQLPRGCDDERADRVPRRRGAMAGRRHERIDDGQRKAGRLSGTGLGSGHHVMARHDHRNGLGLDGGRLGIAGGSDGLEHVGMQAEITEGDGGRLLGAFRRGGS